MLASLGDANGIDKEVEALLRVIESQIGILLHHEQVIAGIVGRDPGLAALHFVKDLVHDIHLHQGLLIPQQIGRQGQQGGILRVDVVAQLQLCNGKGIAGIVKHQNLSRILFVPQQFPAAGIRLVNVFGVVDDADAAPGVGHGIDAARVIGGVSEALVNTRKVGNIGHVQRLQHILGNELFHHIVRRNDDIEKRTAGLELGIHALVAVIGHVVDLDVGIGRFKFLNHIDIIVGAVREVLTPVIDVDCDRISGCMSLNGKKRRQKDEEKNNREQTLHLPTPF